MAACATHIGPYTTLHETYAAIQRWVEEHDYATAGPMWEEYQSPPGTPPERVEVRCRIVMDEVEGAGHRIVASELSVTGRVPGIDGDAFTRAAEAADGGCPFSHLIRASARVTVTATLE